MTTTMTTTIRTGTIISTERITPTVTTTPITITTTHTTRDTRTEMTTQTLGVTGMTCANCVRHVHDTLADIPGVHAVVVDLASGRATLQVEHEIDTTTLRTMLEAEDYGLL